MSPLDFCKQYFFHPQPPLHKILEKGGLCACPSPDFIVLSSLSVHSLSQGLSCKALSVVVITWSLCFMTLWPNSQPCHRGIYCRFTQAYSAIRFYVKTFSSPIQGFLYISIIFICRQILQNYNIAFNKYHFLTGVIKMNFVPNDS